MQIKVEISVPTVNANKRNGAEVGASVQIISGTTLLFLELSYFNFLGNQLVKYCSFHPENQTKTEKWST